VKFRNHLLPGILPLSAAFVLSILLVPASPAHVSAAGSRQAVQTDTLPNTTVKWDMVQIPAGSIEMPDRENPGRTKKHEIKSLWVSKTEVTWELFDIYAFRLDQTEAERAANTDAKSRPSKPYGAPDRGFGHAGYPAISMHYLSAEKFCEWLSKKTGKKYRLPTEAEWEYFTRAGQEMKAPLDKNLLEQISWFWDNADDKTHPVGEKKPNAWGLYDTLGNVAEWVQSPEGKWAGAGGSFLDKADKINPTFRDVYRPEWQSNDAHSPKSRWWLSDVTHIGIRLVREE
jgi:formylglycine-generating enzyme required for sulfatase activity